jgi:hypothetical protein
MATATIPHLAPNPPPQPVPTLSLEKWKQRIFQDAHAREQLQALRCVPAVILELAWSDGYEPSVPSLIQFCEAPRKP